MAYTVPGPGYAPTAGYVPAPYGPAGYAQQQMYVPQAGYMGPPQQVYIPPPQQPYNYGMQPNMYSNNKFQAPPPAYNAATSQMQTKPVGGSTIVSFVS